MYKCSECGAEYDIKPEFCDCGNDIFTEIQGSAKPKEVRVQPQQISQQTTAKTSSKKTFEEQYPEFERFREIFDPISTAIFLGCIIIGLLVIFVVGNPEKKEVKTTTGKENTQVIENIPSIDSIWDNSTAGVINNEKILAAQRAAQAKANTTQPKTKVQKPVNPILAKVENEIAKPTPVAQGKVSPQVIPTPTPVPKPQPQPQVQQKSQPKTQPKPQSQTQTQTKPATKTTTTTSNTSVASTPKTTTQKPNIPKNTQAAANQPKTTTTASNPYANNNGYGNPQQKPAQNTTTTTPKTQSQAQTQTKPQTQKPTQVPVQTTLRPKATIDTQALQKELSNYKVGLRNTIGRKIDFANVIGDGDCAISFNIASNGKLINRKFTKQSSNITLNDAVYKAVMATPSYNPPPSGYNNETMNLRIRFYNGNFDVTLN